MAVKMAVNSIENENRKTKEGLSPLFYVVPELGLFHFFGVMRKEATSATGHSKRLKIYQFRKLRPFWDALTAGQVANKASSISVQVPNNP